MNFNKSKTQGGVFLPLNPRLILCSLYQIWARSHDGHFVFYPDLLTKAFEWGRPHALVSISDDGTSLPQIKIYGMDYTQEIFLYLTVIFRGRCFFPIYRLGGRQDQRR